MHFSREAAFFQQIDIQKRKQIRANETIQGMKETNITRMKECTEISRRLHYKLEKDNSVRHKVR